MTERSVPRSALFARAFALTLFSALTALAFAGCSSKMEEKECSKLKIEAFDVLNKAQHCNNDADCNASDWPDCAKPLSAANAGEIQKRSEAYFAGKCEEQKPACTDMTPIYCKQGLCTRREKASEATP